jgi:alpha-tubulin suppressor-like RCC1 family protein
VLIDLCEQLDLRGLIRVAQTCKRFRHGDGGLETVELPTRSPVVAVLREHAFPGGVGIPSTRPTGCSESWVAYVARCARQRSCREAPTLEVGEGHTLFVDWAGRVLTCGRYAKVGQSDENVIFSTLTPVAAMAAVQVRSLAAGCGHSLALTWDGRVYSWGSNLAGQLGHGDKLKRLSPALVEGFEGVCHIAAAVIQSLASTQARGVFEWGSMFQCAEKMHLRPTSVEGFGGMRVRNVRTGVFASFAVGENGELFSWGRGIRGCLGHGDTEDQPSPKRVEALRDVCVCNVAPGTYHAVALAEDGLVYAWGENVKRSLLGNPHVKRELLPKPVEALRGVRVISAALGAFCSYAVADTGDVWAWGGGNKKDAPLGFYK